MNRRILIVIAVLGLHVLGLWALHAGLLRRAVEWVIPVSVMAEVIEPAPPQMAPAPAQAQQRPAPAQKRASIQKSIQKPVIPTENPLWTATTTPEPAAQAPTPTHAIGTPTTAPTTLGAPTAEPVTPTPSPTPPPPIELPSSSADYLNNPPPPYPPLSKRLGEQGKVVVRVFIEANGTASKAEIRSSSGYDRLDQVALQTVFKWRYIPGKQAGVAQGMWFNLPIQFVLE